MQNSARVKVEFTLALQFRKRHKCANVGKHHAGIPLCASHRVKLTSFLNNKVAYASSQLYGVPILRLPTYFTVHF